MIFQILRKLKALSEIIETGGYCLPEIFRNFQTLDLDSLENSNIEKPRSVRLTVRCVHA